MNTAAEIQAQLRSIANPEKSESLSRFFKSEPGQYGEGDKFLGITVPDVRKVVKQCADIKLPEIEKILNSGWHEERLAAVLILVAQYNRGDVVHKKMVFDFYLAHATCINNWDLVDSSAEFIVGPYLESRAEKKKVLSRLASSENIWERRIAMLATFDYIKKGNADEALIIAEQLLYDKHDLIQKAVGWMLREIGKRVSTEVLVDFLDEHASTMPRTTLRYAIEHFNSERRAHYLSLRVVE